MEKTYPVKVMHKHNHMTSAFMNGKHEENIGNGVQRQYKYILDT